MAKKFPRVTRIIGYGVPIPHTWVWECNFCYATIDFKEAWLHRCVALCECGHVSHSAKRCAGKVQELHYSYKTPCKCEVPAPHYDI